MVFTVNFSLAISPLQTSLNPDVDQLILNAKVRDLNTEPPSNNNFKFRPQGVQKDTNLQLLVQRWFKFVKRLKLGCVRKKWG